MLRIQNVETHDVKLDETKDIMVGIIQYRLIGHILLIVFATIIAAFINYVVLSGRTTFGNIMKILVIFATMVLYMYMCIRATRIIAEAKCRSNKNKKEFKTMINDITNMAKEDITLLKKYENNGSVIVLPTNASHVVFIGPMNTMKQETFQTITIVGDNVTREMMGSSEIIDVDIVQHTGIEELMFYIVPKKNN